ncbi:histidine phosphatase family protein [Bacillus spongiae]|uniref:Histidine phosphatase family protein n=1 Tax=Bacillus spongiae TaxID=2683610 RepID=A0ABU8HBG8_9BACI
MEIIIIRHGESEADIFNVHEGRADFSLTEKGRQQVHVMGERVKNEFPPDMIWASPLKRASETAKLLSEKVGCSVQLEDDLMEFNNGIQAGLTFEEAKKYPEPTYLHDSYEDGESHIEFRMRVESAFSRILSSSQHRRIAIVAHGGVINCLLQSFYQMPVTKDYYFKNGDTGISFIEIRDEERVTHFLNDLSHLA